MGMFGRFREKVHEVAPGRFSPTTSDRIDKMYKEVHDFAQTLKECDKQIKQLETASTAVFKATGDALSRPLPHVYQEDAQGIAQPVVPQDELRQQAATTMGTAGPQSSVRVQDLATISQKHTNDLEQNVLEPLRAWIKEYRTFKDRMSVLDNTRLEFDAERRAFHKLEIKGVHHKQANDAVNPEIAGKLEAKSGDVAAKRNVYNAHEQELYNGLAALINDAKNVRVYLASLMRAQSQAFGAALG
ncbi:TPA: hypothetical protein ACH3X3_011693 [Trebouxia sp. C0006]